MNRKLSPAWMLTILSGLNLFNYLDRYVLSAVLTPLQKELHLSNGQAGRIMTAFMIGYFVTSPFFGYLGDRLPRKWLIAVGIFVWSLGTLLTGYATTFAVLLSYRVLVGLGEASYATISPSLISDEFPPERRNNALTIFYVAIPVGAALGSILGGVIAARYSWREAFIWAGAPGLLLALILLPFKEPERGGMEGKAAECAKRPTVTDILNLFRVKNYMLVVWGYTAYTFALGAFGFWGPTFLTRVHNVAVKDAGTFFGAVLVVAGLLGTLLTGYATTFAVLLSYRVLVGLGEASYATISPSLISDEFPPERRNNALTIFYVAIPVGAALGSILGGVIAARYSWREAFIWAGAPGLLLALILLPFKEPERGGMEGKAAECAKRPTVVDILNLFRIKDYMLVVWGYTAYTFALGAFGFWGPTFLIRVHNVAVKDAGTFFGAVLVVAGLLGTLIGGFAATAWQKRNPAGYAWTLALS
ncbi:MAG TPA: MFS transporter, partial [Verrucomicrobiae bacterium]|nr:MFS transporter [Verrucomicrobiae bacterium]